MPEVLADQDPDPPWAARPGRPERRLEGPEAAPRRQVAGLVEEAVGGQVHLAVDVDDGAAGEVDGRVVKAVVVTLHDAAHHGVDVARGVGERAQLGAVQAHGAVGDQVLEEVPGERELGEHHQVGTLAGGLAEQLQVAGEVGPEVAQPRRDLGQRDHDGGARLLRGRGRLRRRLGEDAGRPGGGPGGGHHGVDSPPSALPPTNRATRAATPDTGSRATAAGGSASRKRRA